ncbi:MAG: ribonuclease Y [Proteobacteria bacterium]|nr:ribonuclease Y [Pseudomonadota bacterium]
MIVGLVAVIGVLIGILVFGFMLHKKQIAAAFETARRDSQRTLEEARKEADELVKNSIRETKEDSRKARQSFEDESRQRRSEISKLEQKLKSREEALEKKMSHLDSRETELETMTKRLQAEEVNYQKLNQECQVSLEKSRKTLESIANMSQEEAKRELIKSLEIQAKKDAQEMIRQIETDAKAEADKRAKSLVSLAVQRISGEYVSDSTITVVALPSEDLKGRIIGREGRNIRAIEQATGVDLIIDDTPEAVIISCFNPVRREVAKLTIERLIGDGRIHPARIDETVKRVQSEFDLVIREQGEQASFDTGITDLHPEIVMLLGKLKYRTAGQQTVLQHSLETAHICGIIAGEMGLNVKKAKRCGLLHDVGKAVDQEAEGHHSDLGAEVCAKYNENADVVEAIRYHHQDDLSNATPYAVVLFAANSLSANRPGARKEVLETYVKRLSDMEAVVKGFEGIADAYVIQAGREVHAIVNPVAVNDARVSDLSSNIAFKLRQELTFPGQVKVTVIRESKFVDYAK